MLAKNAHSDFQEHNDKVEALVGQDFAREHWNDIKLL
jgi:hypothetical protein